MKRRRWSFLMSPEEHDSLRAMHDLYLGLLTPLGRAVLWGAIAAGMLALGGLARGIVQLFAFSAAALIAGALVGWPFRPRVRLQRHLPPPVSAGDRLEYRVSVQNVGWRTLRQVTIQERGLPADVRPAEEPEVIPLLRPGEKAEVRVALHCKLRGVYPLRRLQAASAFPSGLFKWPVRTGGEDRLVVYPRFTPVEGFEVPHGRNYQPGGISVASHVGDSTEFFGTREYRQGDRMRDIHWPSYARTGRLVVKEFQEEYFVRLAMVLDIEVHSAREEKLLEQSLSVAAGIADVLARREYILDLFAAGPRIFHFQAGRALAHFDHLLEILASLESGSRLDFAALEAALLPEAPRLSAVILVMMTWDPKRAALVRQLQERGVAIRVLCLRPGVELTGLDPSEVVRLG